MTATNLPERLEATSKDLGGGLIVRRLLPHARRPSVGPFVFFDHFGPLTAGPGVDHDVRPHPHIGLATVTYLFEGTMMHRDSTGAVQRLEPRALNVMTAGRGVVHSERTPEELRDVPRRSHGLQLWLALPQAHEEDAASFQHVPGQALGTRAVDTGVTASVLIGRAFGMVSAVRVCSPTLLVQFEVDAVREASWVVPALAAEQALFSPEQDFELDDHAVAAGTLAVLEPGQTCQVRARAGSRLMLLGGTPLGPRLVVWNFVSSSAQRIARAREDWIAQRFDPVPGESGFIPYPGVKG